MRVFCLVGLLLVAAAACASEPGEGATTVLVELDHVATGADIDRLEEVGGRLQHRLDLARSVSLRTALTASAFASISGVVDTLTLGPEEDPSVSAFIYTAETPDIDDQDWLRSRGATWTLMFYDQGFIGAVLPLSLAARLHENDNFVHVRIHLYPDETQ